MAQNPIPRPVMLVILDGYGLSDSTASNAVALAHNPVFKNLWKTRPKTQLVAHGTDVGLPPGVMGNSEVGHLNIGAGRIVFQDSSLIDAAVADGTFFNNEVLLEAVERAKRSEKRLHLLGCTSNGGVHASEGHYFALLELASRAGLLGDRVCFHAFTDGRDTPPQSGLGFIARLLEQMLKTGSGCIASVIGRYYAMDRDKRWPRVQKSYECLTQGKGFQAPDAISAVKNAYSRGETDEFILPTVVCNDQNVPRPRIESGDSVIFFNYRSDRGRELMQVFLNDDFDADLTQEVEDLERAKFKRESRPEVFWATMTRYSEDQSAPYAFGPRPQRDGLGEWVSKAGKTQLRVAETEKYPHVTFFFSGGLETPWPGEERLLVPSPDVATYDLQPEMSSPEVTQRVVAAIESQKFDLIVLNYAQTDMVGHTGKLDAAIKAVESSDAGLAQILPAIALTGGALLVIADHGNCELMTDPVTGQPHTAHTINPVPCVLFGNGLEEKVLRQGGRLADIAPTLLDLMGVEKPALMTGNSLLQAGEDNVTNAVSIAQIAGLKGALLRSNEGKINAALSLPEIFAALGQFEARLAQNCAVLEDENARKLADSARERTRFFQPS